MISRQWTNRSGGPPFVSAAADLVVPPALLLTGLEQTLDRRKVGARRDVERDQREFLAEHLAADAERTQTFVHRFGATPERAVRVGQHTHRATAGRLHALNGPSHTVRVGD